MSARPPVNWLDLRLILKRQPALSAFFVAVVLGILWLLAHPVSAPDVPNATGLDPARQAAARNRFRGILLAPEKLPAAQQAVLDIARTQGLTLGQVDYAQESNAGGGFREARMHLLVSGSYDAIRAFIDGALADEPALAIRKLTLRREGAATSPVMITASLTLQHLVGEAAR